MQVSRRADTIGVIFDDERLVANAGLVATATLAEHLGLKDLLDERIDLGEAPGHANAGHKAMTVIHAVLAGADSIDDCEILRAGSTGAVLGHELRAPSTIGTFLRSFSWAHARQIDKAAGEAMARAWAAGAGPADRSDMLTIDLDSSVHETYGAKKEGTARFSYNQVHGYHPLYATVAETGEVAHCRLRGGAVYTSRGAAGFLAERFSRLRSAGATGAMCVRADSGFASSGVVNACHKAGVSYSITLKMYKNLHTVISGIAEQDWIPIPYFIEDGADVAVVEDYQAFPTRGKVTTRLVVRRVRPTPGSQLALLTDWSYHAFIADRPGGPVDLDSYHRAHAEIENVIRDLKYGVGLNHLPSGRFGANAVWLGLNVIAHNLSRWTARIGGIDLIEDPDTEGGDPGRLSFVATDTLRRRYLAIPGRLACSARRLTLHLPARWPWASGFTSMLDNLRTVRLAT